MNESITNAETPAAAPSPPDMAPEVASAAPVTDKDLRIEIEALTRSLAINRVTIEVLRKQLRESTTREFDLLENLGLTTATNTRQAEILLKTQTALEFALAVPTQSIAPEDFLVAMERSAAEYGYNFPSFYLELQVALSKAYAKAPERAARAHDKKKLEQAGPGMENLDGLIAFLNAFGGGRTSDGVARDLDADDSLEDPGGMIAELADRLRK